MRVNDKYRIEFTEETEAGKQIASMCNITELSNHYNKGGTRYDNIKRKRPNDDSQQFEAF